MTMFSEHSRNKQESKHESNNKHHEYGQAHQSTASNWFPIPSRDVSILFIYFLKKVVLNTQGPASTRFVEGG